MFSYIRFYFSLAVLALGTAFSHSNIQSEEAPYAKIREALYLSPEEEKGISPIHEGLFKGKIQYLAKNAYHYAYVSEGVDDVEWGCAWRAIQTSLSSYFDGDTEKVPSFIDLFENYGSRSFLVEVGSENGIDEVYSENWKSPHEDWHMWGDPFVGHMIFLHMGIDSHLIAIHDIPRWLSPRYVDDTVRFPRFKSMLMKHFRNGGLPVMIDNGAFALNILGVGKEKGHLYLLIGDPHLKKERSDHPLNGLYVVELDEKGRQVSIDYPAIDNHFDSGSYQTLQFSIGTSWTVLFGS